MLAHPLIVLNLSDIGIRFHFVVGVISLVNDLKKLIVAVAKLLVGVDSKVSDDSETKKFVRVNMKKIVVGT